jgi:hypothetical protein
MSTNHAASDKRKWSLYKADTIRSRRWWVLAVFAVWTLYVGAAGLMTRLLMSVDGTIISSTTTQGVRPVTYYTIQSTDGQQQSLVAGPTDESLPRGMPVGTIIQKNKFELSYARNGQRVQDFPLGSHVLWLAVSAVSSSLAFVWWKSERKSAVGGA